MFRATPALLLILGLTASAAAPPPDAGWKSLFDGKTLGPWKSIAFGDEGKVHVKDGAIYLEKGRKMTGIVYSRADFPTTDYEITFEAKRVDGDDFFCTTTFPVGPDHCSFVVGGWRGTVFGISNINGANASENVTTRSHELESGRWYRIRLRISRDRIETWIDRTKMVDLDTSELTLSLHLASKPTRPFGITSWDTTGAIRDLRLRRLTDAEKKAIAATRPRNDCAAKNRGGPDACAPGRPFPHPPIAHLARASICFAVLSTY
ncbi:MAG: DUF1080 domain-containing protein [Gemmataceae bacterium]